MKIVDSLENDQKIEAPVVLLSNANTLTAEAEEIIYKKESKVNCVFRKSKTRKLKHDENDLVISINSTEVDPLEYSKIYLDSLYQSLDYSFKATNEPLKEIYKLHKISNAKQSKLQNSLGAIKMVRKNNVAKFLNENYLLKSVILKKKRAKGVFFYNQESKKVNKFMSDQDIDIHKKLNKVDKLTTNEKSIFSVRNELLKQEAKRNALDLGEKNSQTIEKLVQRIRTKGMKINKKLGNIQERNLL